LCSPRAASNVLHGFVGTGKPILVLNRMVDDPRMSNVVVESYPAMRQLADHVVDLGQEGVGAVAWKTMSGQLDGHRPGSRTRLAAEPVIRRSTAPL
jgi:DNA-binding LacI/PurR family transcriptional regulator